jgi:hypothetical protein
MSETTPPPPPPVDLDAERAARAKSAENVVDLAIIREVERDKAKKAAQTAAKTPGTVVDGSLAMSEEEVDARIGRIEAEIRAEEEVSWEPDPLGMPPGCPVVPLGKNRMTFYLLSPQRDVVALSASEFGQGHIDGLFSGKTAYLVYGWPRRGKQNRVGVAYDLVRKSLMDACARLSEREGVFDLGQRVRGRGVWLDSRGLPVVHCGNEIVMAAPAPDPDEAPPEAPAEAPPEAPPEAPLFMREKPGTHDGRVYPSGPSLPPPDADVDAPALGRALLAHLRTWRWARPGLDPQLMLGWTVCGVIAGALKARPQVWLLGDPGTGKSSLQAVLASIMGGRLLSLADATAPAIYQTLKHDALAVGLDEFENEEDQRASAVIKLARIAFSGGSVARGGTDGVPTGYEARAGFLFSAVNRPPLKHAEATRQAMLQLYKLPDGAREAVLDPAIVKGLVPGLLARIVTHWALWQETLHAFQEQMRALGHSGRGADQFGSLLAGAWFATRTGVPAPKDLADWSRGLEVSALVEVADRRDNWRRCLDHLLAAQPDAWRTSRNRTVGALLDQFLTGQASNGDTEPGFDGEPTAAKFLSIEDARSIAAQAGLALVNKQPADGSYSPTWHLGIPEDNAALGKLYEGTEYAARRGTGGGWCPAFRRAPTHIWEDGRFRLNGVRVRGVLVNLAADAEPGEPVFVSSLAAPNDFERSGREPGEEG